MLSSKIELKARAARFEYCTWCTLLVLHVLHVHIMRMLCLIGHNLKINDYIEQIIECFFWREGIMPSLQLQNKHVNNNRNCEESLLLFIGLSEVDVRPVKYEKLLFNILSLA